VLTGVVCLDDDATTVIGDFFTTAGFKLRPDVSRQQIAASVSFFDLFRETIQGKLS
jgi:hypothetical protein